MLTKIPGIKQTTVNGRVYYYHRATGKRIAVAPQSPAFVIEVARLNAEAGLGEVKYKVRRRQQHGSGTWGALAVAYVDSPEYARLAERTKQDYDRILAYLASLNEMPLIQLNSAACLKIRDKAFQQKKRRFANYVIHMLSVVLGWGKPRGFVTENAALGLEKIKASSTHVQQNRAWSDDECCVVLTQAKGGTRIAIALGMFAGMRGGDVVRVGWSAYNGQEIEWRQGKTGDAVWLPAARELRIILDAAPRVATTIVTGASNRPWTEGTLRKEFRTLIASLEKSGQVAKGLTFHGLRSTAATNLANLGADVRAIQAMLGHRSAVMALHYSRDASKRRAGTAAIHLLDERRLKEQGRN
jgi:integrase